MFRDANVIGAIYDVYLEPPLGTFTGATILIVEDRSNPTYPKRVACEFTGAAKDKLAASGIAPGDLVHVRGQPESREYNGKWYTKFRAFVAVKLADPMALRQQPPMPTQTPEQLPF